MGICYPLLKKIDLSIPISQQKGYNNTYARYWTKPILKINGKHYILCSQWSKELRKYLYKWVCNNNSKKNKYVLQKPMRKTCPKCNNILMQDPLFVTYHTDIKNKLLTRKCENYNTYYISEGIFNSWTKNKNTESISVNFIKYT